MKPSKYQQDFYNAVIATPLNIVLKSTAGSGKSTSAIEACKYTPFHKKVLYTAFNKHTAEHLRTKLPQHIECHTMHSIGMKSLRNHFPELHIKKDKQIEFIEPMFSQEKTVKEKWAKIFETDNLLKLIRATMTLLNPEDVNTLGERYNLYPELNIINAAIVAGKRLYDYNNQQDYDISIDFQDMIEMCVKNEAIRLPKFDYVFVDECQDCSRLDQLFIEKLLKKEGRLIAIGDEHQCQPIGTKILMADGREKSIQDIKLGDQIIQFNTNRDSDDEPIYSIAQIQGIERRMINEQLIQVSTVGQKQNTSSWYTTNHKTIVTVKEEEKDLDIQVEAEDLLQYLNEKIIICDLPKPTDKVKPKHVSKILFLRTNFTVSTETYIGYVYSLKVSGNETYVADGIVTHNSIYGFRGSDINSFNFFTKRANTVTLPLTISYRCAKNIVNHAKTIYSEIEPWEKAKEGIVRKGTLDEVKNGDMVLSRNLRPLIEAFFTLIDQGKRASIVGKEIEKGLLSILSRINSNDNVEVLNNYLVNLLKEKEGELSKQHFTNPKTHPRYVSLQEKVEVIKRISSRCDNVKQVEETIQTIFHEDDTISPIRLLTIHKAKGLENDIVFLIQKFEGKQLIPSQYAVTEEQKLQEKNLLFVAYTRAKNELVKVDL